MKALLLHAGVTALLVAAGIAAYDRWVLRPALRVGVVDLSEVYRAKEAQFTQLLTAASASGSDEERERALSLARRFSQRLPAALDELPRECGCLVVLRTAVAGSPHAVDLTPALRRKVDMP
ncbi:hypothetical protein [Paracidovorax anthurii]|uniref:Type F conjugative transfer system protein TrbI n=1 Tax=Paracidovorax anthurii TaxID=78229 RepID=A0A328ZD43_9BURK|nr:hypothetical protein [Paracidovorax anthurii]RAR83574.1 hypothetical protein AX018_101483 [Paracidovorax anthurii]